MQIDDSLKNDPDSKGWVLGWGVVKYDPWHLYGVYKTKEKAELAANKLSKEYEVHYGSHKVGSDDFMWGNK